jgi:hypothetical protein
MRGKDQANIDGTASPGYSKGKGAYLQCWSKKLDLEHVF